MTPTEPNPKKNLPKGTLAILIMLPVLGIVISLALIEVVFRLMPSGRAPVWNDRPIPYFVPEAARTFQDVGYNPVKPEGVYRIAVIGDSFTFAPYMQYDDAFPKRLERYLNLNVGQRRVEVINYGVPRYSTSHEIKTTRQALDEGADLVLLQITLNDPEIKLDWPTGLQLDTQTGEVTLSNPIYRYWKSLAYVRTRIENSRTHREYKDYFFRLFDKKANWQSFSDSMGKLVGLCRKQGVPIAASVFPLFGYPVDDNYPFFPIHQKISGLLDSLEVVHHDISEVYRNVPVERLQVLPGVDRHPNEIAHRMAAEQILAFLKEKRIIPEEIVPKRSTDLRVGLHEVKRPGAASGK